MTEAIDGEIVEGEVTEIIKYDSGLSPENHAMMVSRFNPIIEEMPDLVKLAHTIKVEDAEDTEGMKQAKETRLALKKIRVGAEHMRKDLKAESLRVGKAIDGFNKVILAAIEPAENHLQEQEEFARIQAQKALEAMTAKREAELAAFEFDCTHMEVGAMNDKAYEQLKNTAEAGYKAKIQAEADEKARLEKEAAEKALRDAEDAKALKEANEIKAKAEKAAQAAKKKEDALKKKLADEKAKKDKAIADAKAKADKRIADQRAKADKEAAEAKAIADKREADAKAEIDRLNREAEEKKEAERKASQEKVRLENERIAKEKADEQAKLAAPDIDKLKELEQEICRLHMPQVQTEDAIIALNDVKSRLNALVKELRSNIKSL